MKRHDHPPPCKPKEVVVRTIVRIIRAILGTPTDHGEGPKPPFR